jgi:hypothetical protein
MRREGIRPSISVGGTPKSVYTLSPMSAPRAMALSLALILTPAHAPHAGLPPELDRVRVSETSRLGRLYALSPAIAEAPIEASLFQGPAEATPPGWQGLPAFAAGAAQPALGRLVVHAGRTGRYPFGDAAQTLRHEISHVLLFRALGFEPPRWLDEGLAMRAGAEWGSPDSGYLAIAIFQVSKGTLTLDGLEADFTGGETAGRRSYALARGFVRDLFRSDGEVTAFVLEARRERDVDRAFVDRFGVAPGQAFRAWARNLPWWGEWFVVLGSPGLLWGIVVLLFLGAVIASIRRRRKLYEQLPD